MKKTLFHIKNRVSGYTIAILCIIALGVFLRFFNTPTRYHVDGDSVRDAIVAYEGAKHLTFPLTGPFSSTGPYTFGPWYYISIITFFILLPLPYSPWILMGITSILTILLMADIGRLLYSKKLGIILAVITAIAPSQLDVATSLSNISPITFFATLSFWIVFKIMKREFTHVLWFLLLGIFLGLGINDHYQMFGLGWMVLLLWFIKGWKKIYIPILSGVGVLLTFIPMLVFNIATKWSTITGVREMYQYGQKVHASNSWKLYIFQFWPSHFHFIFGFSVSLTIILLALFLIICCLQLRKKHYSPAFIMMGVIFCINFFMLRYYWAERHDVYLYYLTPILYIFVGYIIVYLWGIKYIKFGAIALFICILWSMVQVDYVNLVGGAADNVQWSQEAAMLHSLYPKNNIILYSCSPFGQPHKQYVSYRMQFYNNPHAPIKRIGMKESECSYPEARPSEKREHVYPSLLPSLKNEVFTFIDLSPATLGAVKFAHWSAVDTKKTFDEAVNWWK